MQIDENIKSFGKQNKVPISLDDTLCFLCKTIMEENSKQILEIGTAIGFSSITMADNTPCQHIDTLEIDADRYQEAKKNIASHNLQDKITPYLIDAIDYLKTCKKTYNLIYLDGPKGQYINYLPYLINILEPNGIIIADNLFFHGMVTGKIPITKGCRAMIKGLKNYINAIQNHPNLVSRILDIGDGLGISRKKEQQ